MICNIEYTSKFQLQIATRTDEDAEPTVPFAQWVQRLHLFLWLWILTFTTLLANSADDKVMIFFLFFTEMETICMNCQTLFSWEK